VPADKIHKLDLLECYDVLYGLASAFNVQSYLEVGVREGASLCCVLAKDSEIAEFALTCLSDGKECLTPKIMKRVSESFTVRNPYVELFLFDNWSYVGCENGRERVRQLLEFGFGVSNYHFFDGDSHKTLPEFKGMVDLAFVDGDHTVEGATQDLEDVLPHAKIIVFHDLFHPEWQGLDKAFIDWCRRHDLPYLIVGRKVLGTGIAFNIW